MTPEHLILAMLGAACSFIAWVLREALTDLRNIERELKDHKVEVAKDYMTNAAHSEAQHRIEEFLVRIEDKLERHVQKG